LKPHQNTKLKNVLNGDEQKENLRGVNVLHKRRSIKIDSNLESADE